MLVGWWQWSRDGEKRASRNTRSASGWGGQTVNQNLPVDFCLVCGGSARWVVSPSCVVTQTRRPPKMKKSWGKTSIFVQKSSIPPFSFGIHNCFLALAPLNPRGAFLFVLKCRGPCPSQYVLYLVAGGGLFSQCMCIHLSRTSKS